MRDADRLVSCIATANLHEESLLVNS